MRGRRLESIEALLTALVRGSGIEATALDEALIAFDDAWRKREAYLEAERRDSEAGRRRGLLLNGRSRGEVEAALSEREEAVRRTLDEHPRLEGGSDDPNGGADRAGPGEGAG